MIKYSIKFQLFGKEHTDGTLSVRMRISWKGERVDTLLPVHVPSVEWIQSKGKVKGNYHNGIITGAILNNKIQQYRTCIEKLFAEKDLSNNIPTIDDVKKAISSVTNGTYTDTDPNLRPFHTFFSDYFDHGRKIKSIKESTIVTYTCIQNSWIEMDAKLTPKDIDDKKMEDFVEFCYQRGNHNITIARFIASSKTILRYCKKQGIQVNDSAINFKTRLIGTSTQTKEIIYLTWDETMHLMNYSFDMSKPYYRSKSEVRDMLLLSCFTGLRYSDVNNLRWADIYDEAIHVITKKTTTALTIELNKFAKIILDRQERGRYGSQVFKSRDNTTVNETLKTIGRIVGLNTPTRTLYFHGNERVDVIKPKYELLSTHCGRRTFVVNAMRLGIPTEVIMQWTGHANHNSMKPYMKVVSEIKKESMTKFDNI